MIIVAGHFSVADTDNARPATEELVIQSRLENDSTAYSYAFDFETPNLVRVFEIWESESSFQAHGASDHLATWRKTFDANGISELRIDVFEATHILERRRADVRDFR